MVVAEVVPPIPAIQEAVEGEVNPKVSSWVAGAPLQFQCPPDFCVSCWLQ